MNYDREDLEATEKKVKLMSTFLKEEQDDLTDIVTENQLFIHVLIRAAMLMQASDPLGFSSLSILQNYYLFLAGYMIGSGYEAGDVPEELDSMWKDAINDLDNDEE